MPKPTEVTKENMQSENRGQAGGQGDSWISWTEGQKDRRTLGRRPLLDRRRHHGHVPQQERGFSPQKSPFDMTAFLKVLVAKAKLLKKKKIERKII